MVHPTRSGAEGMAVAAVRDWQLLVAALYVRLAAEAGLIGFACTNFILLVAPPGGRTDCLRHQSFRVRPTYLRSAIHPLSWISRRPLSRCRWYESRPVRAS